jgi:hypothetical protein
MQDDDLADATQQLLDAFDDFLANPKLVEQLSASDLKTMKIFRSNMDAILDDYRRVLGITERRPNRPRVVPSGLKKGMLIPAVLTSAGTLAGTTGLEVGAGTAGETALGVAIGEVILPVAIFALAIVTLPNAGAEMARVVTEDLQMGLRKLIQRLIELDALDLAIMMTAEAAAALSTQELLKLLKKIIENKGALLTGALTILAELAKRFPGCLSQVTQAQDLVKRLARLRTAGPRGSAQAWVTQVNGVVSDLNKALAGMLSCIAISG